MADESAIEVDLTGPDLLSNPILNKGTAFTESERDEFGLHGFLPPHLGTLDDQICRRLYALRFPIRHMQLSDFYGPAQSLPADGDVSESFECRQAVPSPCTGGSGTGSWSEHAYGEAIDLNPVENPYVGCGMTRDAASRPYLDRSRLRPGMVTPAVVAAFRSIGWGWGGAWRGSTKDYMHFSATGH